jgi:peptidoglycan/LPS O-acetylase OafA/YrhL
MARLWPALVLMVVTTGAVAGISWWRMLVAISWLETPGQFIGWGSPLLLGHCWSLAVEVQFYLTWALVMRRARRWPRRRLQVVCVTLVGMSQAARAVAAVAGLPLVAYFATPMHCDGLLGGAAVAAGLRFGRGWRVLLPAACVMLGIEVMCAPYDSVWSMTCVVPLTVVCTAFTIDLVTRRPGSVVSRLLAHDALGWIGSRSYSLYLWHYPLFAIAALFPVTSLLPVKLVMTVAVADASFRAVEVPARRWLNERNPFVETVVGESVVVPA